MTKFQCFGSLAVLVAAAMAGGSAQAQQFGFTQPLAYQAAPQFAMGYDGVPQAIAPQQAPQAPAEALGDNEQLPPRLQRQVVDYPSKEAPGTVVVDTPHTFLYFVLGDGKAIRYGIGVGRKGFTWSGVKSIARKTEWPDWYPPKDMLKRQPFLPRMMAGGPGNPLGARAMYIAGTEYRIHGTNNPASIGKHVSSGCIRMTNDNAIDLYSRVQVGAKVIVLPQKGPITRQASAPAPAQRVRQPVPQPTYVAPPRMTFNGRPAGLY